jgi:predicted nucleic acid-binding protein
MELPQQLTPFTVLGLDTTVFIYHLEAHPAFLPLTQSIFECIAGGQKQAVTSAITLMEINVRPLQLGRPDIARKYEAILANFPNLEIVAIDREVARRAAQLRAEFRLHPADALQMAACLCGGAQVFITNDHQLSRMTTIPVCLLDSLI